MAAASKNSGSHVNKDRLEPYKYVTHVYNYNIIILYSPMEIYIHMLFKYLLKLQMQVFNGE